MRSTSTPAPASTSTEKVRVRHRGQPLTATRLREARPIDLPNGNHVVGQVDDWIITRGQQIVDWAPSDTLTHAYEVLVEGELRLPPYIVRRLEETLGIGNGRDPHALVEAVERLATITIGTVRVSFSPGQLDELAHRAKKRGRTVEQELRAAVDRVQDEIFHRS